jgi:hypothetical protein
VPLDVAVVSVGNMVFVTTNGATPTTNLTPYASGTLFSVTSRNEPLRAIAWTNSDGRLPSSVTSAYYSNAVASSGDYFLVASNTSTTATHDYVALGNNAEHQQVATKWVPDVTTNINRIELLLGKLGAGAVTGALTLRIYGDTGVPTNILATAATVDATSLASVGSTNWEAFNFSSPQPVTNGATYWIVLHTTQSPSFADYAGWWAGADFVSNGSVHGADDVSWTNLFSKQMNFKVYSP